MHMRVKVKVAAGLTAVAMLATGCLGGSSKSGTASSNSAGGNKNTSKNVTIMTGLDQSTINSFQAALKPFLDSSGIKVTFQRLTDFNNQITLKVKANQLPDIALFPQPGIMKQIQKLGKLAPLDDVLDIPTLKTQLVSGLLDTGTVDGKVYAIPPSINVKSVVFYPKVAWAAKGYQVPTTLDDLIKLSDTIKASGATPWCMGIESTTATGWPATDWIEDLVLRYGGIDQYNQWVNHTIKFDSPLVKQAADYYQKIFSTAGYINGGRKSIAGNTFGTAGNAMFNSPPGCYLFKQGNFITGAGFFPAKIVAQLDSNVGVFYFPGVKAADKPVLGGGDAAALFSGNNESAKAVLKQMFTPDFCAACPKMTGSSYISPFKTFALTNYPNEVTKQMASIAYNATTFAFDGSDQMPGAVGSGSFWKQMTSWVAGNTSEESALKAIDASWPKN